MLYTGERNHGCRFLEVTIHGYRSIILENEKIRTMFILDKGCEIVELNYKKIDTDFLWRSPLGLSCLKKIEHSRKDDQHLTDAYTGGWFECFPNTGGACTYKGANMPQYGEVYYLPWEYTVVNDSPEQVSLKCFVRTTKTPFNLEKTFTVKTMDPTLYIEEEVQNVGREELNFQWGHHPNLGANFIDDNCTIGLSAEKISVHYVPENSDLKVGEEGEWPYLEDKNGKLIDLSKIPVESGFTAVIDVFDLKEGKLNVFNKGKNLGIQFEWDLAMFKHNLLWYVFNGDSGYPRYGDTYVFGFVPHNDRNRGLSEAEKHEDSPRIKAGEIKKTWLKVEVMDDRE